MNNINIILIITIFVSYILKIKFYKINYIIYLNFFIFKIKIKII